ncbi:ABC transporter ATP-binding protein [Thermostilla marina]
MSEPLVRLNDVTFAYAEHLPVLCGCSFALRAGEKVGLIGPNGSGKTTLLGLIVGLLSPNSGTVEVLGKVRRRTADFDEILGRVGLLFQDSDDQLFCPTVAEDVAFGPFNQGKTRDEVRRIVRRTLDSLGLSGMENRITYRLSGGEKRMVALAAVLAMEPDVLLLDEPTAGLDETAVERVREAVARLPQAMLIVSHDRPFLESTVDRLVELRDGAIVPVDGPTDCAKRSVPLQ